MDFYLATVSAAAIVSRLGLLRGSETLWGEVPASRSQQSGVQQDAARIRHKSNAMDNIGQDCLFKEYGAAREWLANGRYRLRRKGTKTLSLFWRPPRRMDVNNLLRFVCLSCFTPTAQINTPVYTTPHQC